MVTYFAIAFGCGYVWRVRASSGIIRMLVTLFAGGLLGYIAWANVLEIGGVDRTYWTETRYNDDETLFYQHKMRFSPFPARVLGVRYYNKHGKFAGASAEQPCNYKLSDMRLGEIPDGSADILLHKQYKPKVRDLLADCKEAFRQESGRTTIYLFSKNDTLRRIEVDHYENGIVSNLRRYDKWMPDDWHYEETRFDELGVLQSMYYTEDLWSRGWRIHDFRVEAEVPGFSYGYDDPDNPKLDERVRNVSNYHTLFERARDSLKKRGEQGDNLSVALLIKGDIQ